MEAPRDNNKNFASAITLLIVVAAAWGAWSLSGRLLNWMEGPETGPGSQSSFDAEYCSLLRAQDIEDGILWADDHFQPGGMCYK